MSLVLGIDPGSRCTGYGIISHKGQRSECVIYGTITPKSKLLNLRLQEIYQGLVNIIETYQPSEAAIEEVFMHKNPQSALKLGQARGVAIVATASHALPLGEYSPRQIKQAIVGYGAASKSQIQIMIKALLKLDKLPTSDAADALAIALCHCHTQAFSRKLSEHA